MPIWRRQAWHGGLPLQRFTVGEATSFELLVSSLNFGLSGVGDALERARNAGYTAVELSSGHLPAHDDVVALQRATESGMRLQLHNYAPPEADALVINLSHPDPDERARSAAFVRSRLRLSRALGAPYYAFHAGYCVPYQFGTRVYGDTERLPRPEALRVFIETLRGLVAEAETLDVHMGVENHNTEPGNEQNLILFDRDDFTTLFQEIPSQYLHLHLDVGHLKVSSRTCGFSAEDFIEDFAERVMAVHLHDNDGRADTHEPFGAEAWFLPELPRLTGLRYAILETRSGGDHTVMGRMEALVRSTMRASG